MTNKTLKKIELTADKIGTFAKIIYTDPKPTPDEKEILEGKMRECFDELESYMPSSPLPKEKPSASTSV